jgi:uncharacterized protein (DUF433 family)
MADQLSRITLNPEVCHGKPTIRGLRYPVEMLLDLLEKMQLLAMKYCQ